MFKLLRNRKGVTLVEVLAVVVILGIIAAIAVPTIGNLIDNQREKAAETQWGNIEDAAGYYVLQEDVAAGETFTLDDIVTAGYIDLDGVLVTITEDGDTSTLVDIEFDENGDLSSGGPVFVNGYAVVPA